MVDDEGKVEEETFDTTIGMPALPYIFLEQAILVAIQTARDEPGDYGPRFEGVQMVFNVVEQEEGEDYHVTTMSFRPLGDFRGRLGQEQFFVEMEGRVAYRQVLSLPIPRRVPLLLWGLISSGILLGVIALAAFIVPLIFGFEGTNGHGHSEAERQAVRISIETMMVDKNVAVVTANDTAAQITSTTDFGGGQLITEYLRDLPTEYCYTWTTVGEVTQAACR